MGDISLILGTVLSQLSIGTFIATFVVAGLLGKADARVAFRTYLVSFVAGVVGLGAMILHLGHPLLAFNAFLNLGRSWLSREVLFYGGFLALSFVFLICQKLNKEGLLKPLGLATTLCGVCAVFVTSMIYTVPGVPAWYSANTPVSFALTAVMLGVSLAFFLNGDQERSVGGAKLVAVAATVALAATVVYVSTLLGGSDAAAGSAYLMTQSALFWVRLVLLAAAGCGAGFLGVKAKGGVVPVTMFGGLFVLLAVSEFIGRFLFFSTIVRL